MNHAARQLVFAAGVIAVIVLISRLPDGVFRATQALLVVTAAAVLALLAASVVLAPARRLLARVFALPLDADRAGVATPEELRVMARPLFVALVCLAVAEVPALIRAL